MANAFLHGAGGADPLNFKVVGGTTAPASPKENTIWVNTDTTITSYVFSATEPTGSDGMVWITTGTASGTEFNALKKNGIRICPISAKQYISGAWVSKAAKSYQGGKWAEWWDGYLYKAGDECTNVTNGWERKTNCNGTFTKNADNIYMHTFGATGVYGYSIVHTGNPIDLTPYSKLKAVTTRWEHSSGEVFPRIGVNPSVPASYDGVKNTAAYISSGSELDISGLSGEYYVFFGCAIGGSGTLNHWINVTEIQLM